MARAGRNPKDWNPTGKGDERDMLITINFFYNYLFVF